MRTLVLGSGGMIGDAVFVSLLEDGHDVVCAARTAEPLETDDLTVRRVDRNYPDQVRALVQELKIEVVIDIVAYDAASTRNLLTALEGQIDQYVLLSSCDVYRNYGLLHRSETGRPDPSPLIESSPLRSHLYPYRLSEPRGVDDPQKWLDDYDKIPIEAHVREFQGKWTILRLPMVFGPGDPQKRFLWAIRPMLAGSETISIPSAWLDWTTTYGFVENIASTISSAVGNSRFAGATFNIVDIKPKSHRAWLRDFSKIVDWRGEIIETHNQDHPIAAATANLNLKIPLVLSGSSLFNETDQTRMIAHDIALEKTIDSFRSRHPPD